MAIPARDIGRIKIRQGFGFNNNIFQNFVNGMTDMDIAIGIGRAIVQDKGFLAFFCTADLTIEIILRPLGQHLRFPLRQITAHGKGRFR